MGGLTDEETNSEYYSYLAKRHKKRIEYKKAKVKKYYLDFRNLQSHSPVGKTILYYKRLESNKTRISV
jgi:hypothetical protein